MWRYSTTVCTTLGKILSRYGIRSPRIPDSHRNLVHAGKYLSYDAWNNDTSARVVMQSATAKRPKEWLLTNKGGANKVTLQAVCGLVTEAIHIGTPFVHPTTF